MYIRPVGTFTGPRQSVPTRPLILQQNIPIIPITSSPFIVQSPAIYPFNASVQNPLQIMQPQLPRPLPHTTNIPINTLPINNHGKETVNSSTQTDVDICFTKVNLQINY